MSRVDLGFSEPCDPWEVTSPHFPSKIGGKPAWLCYENLPTDLQCDQCKQPLIFLLQIYAPYEEDDDNFHRTIFIFVCKNSACSEQNSGRSLRAYRNSLRRDNKFYAATPPEDGEAVEFDGARWAKLCNLCGSLGTKTCGNCKRAMYCTREHQIADWKERHKANCGKPPEITRDKSSHLFTELEIVIEAEELSDKNTDEEVAMAEFNKLELEGKTGILDSVDEEELQQHALDEDKYFSKFRKRIAQNADQILRYDRGGEPLWIAETPRPEAIPNCKYCGGVRQFEFQIMPQLLSILKENELDFGILAVYTCKESCVREGGYKTEYIFRQDVSKNE